MEKMKYIGSATEEFEKWIECSGSAPDSVRNAYNAMHDAFNAYLDECESEWWKQGYNWAMKQIFGGGAK